jgi:hypothetical protein
MHSVVVRETSVAHDLVRRAEIEAGCVPGGRVRCLFRPLRFVSDGTKFGTPERPQNAAEKLQLQPQIDANERKWLRCRD